MRTTFFDLVALLSGGDISEKSNEVVGCFVLLSSLCSGGRNVRGCVSRFLFFPRRRLVAMLVIHLLPAVCRHSRCTQEVRQQVDAPA